MDRKTGELLVFGYDLFDAFINFSVFDKDKKLVNYLRIPLETPRMIHDFMITENYVIIPDNPVEFLPHITVTESKMAF